MDFLLLFQNDFLVCLPEIYLLSAACILLTLGVFAQEDGIHKAMGRLTLFALGVGLLLVFQNPIQEMLFFYHTLKVDGFTFFLKSLILSTTFGVMCLSADYLHKENIRAFEYYILVLIIAASLLLLVSSNDILALYLALECVTLTFYVLASCHSQDQRSTEAGLKYFVLGAFSSGILLFGFALLYGFTGLTNFEDLTCFLTGFAQLPFLPASGLVVSLVFICVGFLFKLTLVPFHMWAPDVYQGAPTAVTALLAMPPKVAFFGVFLKLLTGCFYEFIGIWQGILLVCSLSSMVFGGLAAIAQLNVKRLLAFSSMTHMGYMMMGVASGTLEGMQALVLYLSVYMAMSLITFGVLLSLRTEEGESVQWLSQLSNLGKHHPLIGLSLSLTLLSLAGIPPLAGFLGKFYLFFASLSAGLYGVALVGILASVVSCFYYLRVIKVMYFESVMTPKVFISDDPFHAWVMAVCFTIVVGLSFYPAPFFLMAHKVALALCS